MRWLWLVLGLAGCAKCGAAVVVDAGVDAGAAVRRSIDLRTALVQAYPEYRGTALVTASASTTRTYLGLTPAQRDEAFSKLGFALGDGGEGWRRAPFTVTQPAPDTLSISLPLSAEDVGNLYLAPAGLSSEELALYLPRGLPAAREDFEVALHYASSPERCLAIVRQAVRLLTAAGVWKVTSAPPGWSEQPDDGGPVDLPEAFEVTVETPGTRIAWRRERGQVWVDYRLETLR